MYICCSFDTFFYSMLNQFIHTSTCPLLWWWYDDDVACSVFIFLQNCLNLSEMKLPPASDITFFGKHYSEKSFCMLILSCMQIDLLPFYDQKFAVIIYNAKVVFVI